MPIHMKNPFGGWQRSTALPLVLLLLALATLFPFGNDRGHFYRPGHHDWISSEHLTLAANLSADHSFTRFHYLKLDRRGNLEPSYLYNRFPIGGFVLIKLAILPFGDDLSAKILAARMLMLACFAAAAVLAYLALGSITGSRWIACAATGLAFSSYYCLYYSDMISTEVVVDVFAVMLVFHGMTVFVQESRFRQLLVKTCIALLLGWHVYALLLPFIAFSLANAMFRAHTQLTPPPSPLSPSPLSPSPLSPSPLDRMRRLAGLFFLSRPFALGVIALVFGLLVLSLNLLGEHYARNGATPIAELPTWKSMMRRTGQDQEFQAHFAHLLSWPIFLESQLRILGSMIFPYSLAGYVGALQLGDHPSAGAYVQYLFPVGLAALAVCLVWLCFNRQKILLATLMLSGFFWSIPMRHAAALHDFEGVFYVGVPLTLFSLILLHMRKLLGERLMASVAVAALLVFVFSNWQMSRVGQDAADRVFDAEVIADFQAIRSRTAGGAIGVVLTGEPGNVTGAPYALSYYLAQRVLLFLQYPPVAETDLRKLEFLDFIVTNWRESEVDTLTPENQRFFLYSRDAYVGRHDSVFRKRVDFPLVR